MMLLVVYLAHASTITTLIVHQNKPLCTFSADVTEHIALTSQNVDIALSFIEMIVISAV